MKLQKVLIIYKKSTFQIQVLEHRESRFLKLVEEGHEAVTRVKVAHSEHYSTLQTIQNVLSERHIDYQSVARAEINGQIHGVDLVISVGGDGTFLDCSHFVQSTPLLGVNSSRSSSFGHFCLANADNFARILDEISSDKTPPVNLLRLELSLNGSVLPELVLNEVLICHRNPAGTSRYFLELAGKKEEQRSGGIWVGPPAGSTGAIRAASGRVLPISDQVYQYIVREPGPRPNEHWQLLKGLVQRTEKVKVISQMRTGSLYIDGQHIDYGFALGDELIITGSSHDLKAFVNPNVNEIFQA